MARGEQARAKCNFCGREMTKGGLTRHLPACPERKAAIEAANQQPGQEQTLYHLRAQDTWSKDFWLDLEMNGSAPLESLDSYLRAIWLECCGHLSQFSVGGWRGREIPMQQRADQVFGHVGELTHIYDFGTSSETLIRVINERKGKPLTSHPIKLMARNNMPEVYCRECERPAAWLCMTCVYERQTSGLLCDVHAQDHPCEDYSGLTPLVNSPRVGMCGYDGPAEPPY